MLCPLGADEVQQQNAHVVAADQFVAAPAPDGDAAAVAVGVGGDEQIRPGLLTVGKPQFHGFPDLRVGIGTGGEMPVGRLLLLHHGDVGKAALPQNAGDGDKSRAVEGRVDHRHASIHLVPEENGLLLDPLYEGGEHFLPDQTDLPRPDGFVKGHGANVPEGVGAVDVLLDLHGGVGGDLTAVGPVRLIPVVLRRVVGGGDHHAPGGVKLTDGEGYQRHGRQNRI